MGWPSFSEKAGLCSLSYGHRDRQDSHLDLRASVKPLVANQQDRVRLLVAVYHLSISGRPP